MNILENVEVEYVTFEGWKTSISECRTFESLPENAKKYVKYIEDFLKVPSNIRKIKLEFKFKNFLFYFIFLIYLFNSF